MPRLLSTLLVLVLLGATTAAFAVTEGLKLEPSPISATKVDKVFSPTCACSTDLATIRFRLRKTDRLTVAIVDSGGHVVRTLLGGKLRGPGRKSFIWNGLDSQNVPVSDGSYKPRIHLRRAHRTILLPNPIVVDTVAPRATLVGFHPAVLSPDGDHRHDVLRVHYRLSEPARALLYVNGVLRVKVKQFRTDGELRWYGKVDGVPLPAGSYRIELRGQDRAGNVTEAGPAATLRVRYIELSPRVVHVRAQTRFGVRVSTDAKRYRWRLGKRRGVGRQRVLVLRAGYAGRYRLVVTARGHSATTVVIVGRRP
ncbi:MAG: FlgD immunoglobulin-like domain containing protein [Gaiellaceae bacterium]